MTEDFKSIFEKFDVDDEYIEARPLGKGAINDTYEIVCKNEHYVLQNINYVVFKHPADVMDNIFLVTEHLREKLRANGEDEKNGTLEFIRTKNGNTMHQDDENSFYRMYRMVQGAVAMEYMENAEMAYNAAAAFGKFQRYLADLDSNLLTETIVNYHDTRYQYKLLLDAIRADICGNASACQPQIMFVLERSDKLGEITAELKDKRLPMRVTHNDTKCSNLLMDPDTGKSVCVIDLDTVMPGSALYDFGDAIRSGACIINEKECIAELCLEFFQAYTEGYLSEMDDYLTGREKRLLIYSAWVMTMGCGIRYLTDYLSGGIMYNKGKDEAANLDKAIRQFCLVLEIEEKWDDMQDILSRMGCPENIRLEDI